MMRNQIHPSSPSLIDNIFINTRATRARVLFSIQNLAVLEAKGAFPKRIRLGPNRIAWPLADILAWMQDKVDSRPAFPPANHVIVDANERFIGKPELRKIVTYTPQHLRFLELKGQFPPRIRIGENRSAWLQSEVRQWIEERLQASRNVAS
ncbi:MAG: AlpA family phage regulatory protein [Hyphomicrobium sp.]|jgi:prophage regulatory protein